MEHRKTFDTESLWHNELQWLIPRDRYLPASELMKIPDERLLAENAIYFFITNSEFTIRDRAQLQSAFSGRGWNMFIWKYYAAARCYLGGYKALSACLKLRRAL